jgi:tripartite-type tricarboxylate transporter receptor subunit TctC
MFDNLPSASEFIRAGTLRGIAVTTKDRAPSFPDMPTIAEGGLAGYETYTWNALFAPPNTPKAVVDQLNAEALKAVQDPAVQERLKTFAPRWSARRRRHWPSTSKAKLLSGPRS